jgi:cyclopropane fatty-acyl-phospholipid synthase-like methyltransferase
MTWSAVPGESSPPRLDGGQEQFYKKDFWQTENLKFTAPHFRLVKVARIVRELASGRRCDVLDVGCGPATLARLIPTSVRYHGIDIAVHSPAHNLIEMDFLEQPVSFRDERFDLIVAQGVFEYVGRFQSQKLAEIRELLRDGGKFIVTYTNYAHRQRAAYWAHNNVQPPAEFRRDLERFFRVEKCFASSHSWHQSHPNRKLMRLLQSRLDVRIPVLSTMLAVDYIYICSPLKADAGSRPSG